MSNSSLISFKFTNHNNYSSRRGHKITKITIHHAAGVGTTLQGLANNIKSRECSYTYGIESSGRIGLYVDEQYKPWTTLSDANDVRAVTIEVANCKGEPNWEVSDAALKSTINLCVDVCRRNGIAALVWTGQDASNIPTSNLSMHKWYMPTACPGPYLSSKFPYIVSEVNKMLGTNASILSGLAAGAYLNGIVLGDGDDMDSYSYGIMGTTEQSQAMVDTTKLYPYIITTDRRTIKVDYEHLKKIGVRGAVFEAGRLYDAVYREMTYMNMNIDKQIEEIKKAELPYGLWADVRARNELEARKELKELSLVVRAFPPEIGLWLQLNFIKDKATNNHIIDVYYETMVKLGLKDQCGFYVTKSQLDKIDWKKYQEKWYLWLVEHESAIESIPALLTPEYFVVK